jgi:hypothetical protein
MPQEGSVCSLGGTASQDGSETLIGEGGGPAFVSIAEPGHAAPQDERPQDELKAPVGQETLSFTVGSASRDVADQFVIDLGTSLRVDRRMALDLPLPDDRPIF